MLGAGSDVVNPAVNDPRRQFLSVDEIDAFSVYVRFEPNNDPEGNTVALFAPLG